MSTVAVPAAHAATAATRKAYLLGHEAGTDLAAYLWPSFAVHYGGSTRYATRQAFIAGFEAGRELATTANTGEAHRG